MREAPHPTAWRPSRRRLLATLGAAAAALPSQTLPQGFAGLGTDTDGFALPRRGHILRFPADHGAHPAFRIEWWYLTANLRTEDGAACGVQWTLFRTALRPPGPETVATGWDSPQVWFAHAAVTTAGSHRAAETFARGGIGQAGVRAAPFDAWINDWHLRAQGAMPGRDGLDRLEVRAQAEGVAYGLTLDAGGAPLLLHGEAGYSTKSPDGHASHYYSQPHYQVSGEVTLPGGPARVTGRAWLDREWSSQSLRASQTGWDWMALHLAGGRKLMVARVRDREGPGFRFGTLASPDGTPRSLPGSAITMTPRATTRVAGRRLPTAWDVHVPSHDIALTTAALNPLAWMDTAISYWEGPVTVAGRPGGEGYLEMTGYE